MPIVHVDAMNKDNDVLGLVGIRNRGRLHRPGHAGPVAYRPARVVRDDGCFVEVFDVVQIQPRAGLGDDVGALGRPCEIVSTSSPLPMPASLEEEIPVAPVEPGRLRELRTLVVVTGYFRPKPA